MRLSSAFRFGRLLCVGGVVRSESLNYLQNSRIIRSVEMASEAQRLIGMSLTKIAQSRSHRGGVSLHKNLLVATVLQKAKYIFMEEAYNMVHYQQPPAPGPARPVLQKELAAITAEDADGVAAHARETACDECRQSRQDKENQPPSSELTYLDLERPNGGGVRAKRRRAVTEWETEEAVQSILPKRCRQDEDDVFVDDTSSSEAATALSDTVSKETATNDSERMEIDRITSLVSIFSFSMGDSSGKLNRSVSTPDLCSAQAKDLQESALQQRPFLAMTV